MIRLPPVLVTVLWWIGAAQCVALAVVAFVLEMEAQAGR